MSAGEPNADAAATLPRICFLHMPRTAGSSIRSFFLDRYGDLAFHAHTTLDYQAASDAELTRYRFFAGHAYRSDWSRLPDATRFLTILREPADRVISLYRYWNAVDLDYLESAAAPDQFLIEAIRIARGSAIEEFAVSSSAAIVEHVQNGYARQLVTDPLALNRAPDSLSLLRMFDQAVEVLFSFDAVLTTERLNHSFAPALAHIGIEGAGAILPRENRSAKTGDCNREELQYILSRISPLDYQLYAVARQLEARFL